jgi:hypothetical protein
MLGFAIPPDVSSSFTVPPLVAGLC